MSTKVEQRLQWRRDKVRELTVKGHNQRQIAAILKIGVASVNEDLQYMRQEAKQNITKFIDDYLPAEYEFVLDGVSEILVAAWNITREKDSDKREQLQALTLAKDCYAMRLDLGGSSTVIDRAVEFVERNRGIIHQNELAKDDSAAGTKQIPR